MREVIDFMEKHTMVWQVVQLLLMIAAAFIVVMVLLRLENVIARKLVKKNKNINFRFVESVLRFVLILLAVQWVVMSSPITQSFGKVLFQGTAVIAAIAGFAAQPVIADMICGLMLSATKPFDIGDRIELEDGSAGIVKDITTRHVVLQGIDTVEIIIPNSKLNDMKLKNMSRQHRLRSINFRFHVAYHTDVDQAMAVIRRAVEECPYSVPARDGKTGPEYGPVYFIQYADSSLVMTTTVYYTAENPTERVTSDVNRRVKAALDVAGIEIPYNYVHVVMNEEKERAVVRTGP